MAIVAGFETVSVGGVVIEADVVYSDVAQIGSDDASGAGDVTWVVVLGYADDNGVLEGCYVWGKVYRVKFCS
jgi:hypothetical protein